MGNYQQLIVVSKDTRKSESSVTLPIVTIAANASTSCTSIDENVNSKMIQQQTVNQAPPRLHPKKRKFDLSELEDDHHPPPPQTSTSILSSSSSLNTSVATVYNPAVTISSPSEKFSTTVVYHHKTSDPNHNGNSQQQQQMASGNFSSYNPQHVVTQVVKNTGEVQQFVKRQFTSYR